ncbi:hypothetical protein BTVI_14840 [Pitangus sulphuratus]|nr:hypothetical protein BTVI_14840 [Pitangus sulphuratus]
MPASCTTDPPLAKANPIRYGGRASGITFKKEENPSRQVLQPERGVRIHEGNNSADNQVCEGGGEGDVPGTGAENPPAACNADHSETGCPLKSM